jgi:transcriptional regulator with XRE-family HTH domain
MRTSLAEIGNRLRAHRLGAGLTAEEAAAKLHVSRAALYRYEKFGVGQLEILERIARLLDVSLSSLLGVGVEYTSSLTTYLERFRQVEEEADWLFVLFGPTAYVFTSDEYDRTLEEVVRQELTARMHGEKTDRVVANVMEILKRRKETYRRRLPTTTVLISASDIRRFANFEFSARDDRVDRDRLDMAKRELRRIAEQIRRPSLGVQVGIVFDRLPTTSFSIVRQGELSTLLISPFRLGPEVNVSSGVAMITAAEDAVGLHLEVAKQLWSRAITGEAAADFILSQLD